MRPLRVPIAVCLIAALSACASLETGGEPSYAESAEKNLQLGVEALEAGNHPEAEKYFEHVRTRFPFLSAAKDAELFLADVQFARERYLEARDRYQNFVKVNPTHPRVDYAAFRAAMTHHKEIPSDFFLLPPSAEKDQIEVRNSLGAMTRFIREHPKSKFVPEAQELVADARRRLVEHELYVADFYARREKWNAVANRLERVVTQFPGSTYEEQAWFSLVDAYTKLKDTERTQKTLQRIIEKMPGTPAADRAKQMLGS